ncbi:protein FAM222A [Electrophorus electricus]|uniref:protein FAM222A n=1 Tax=Electrophorus electricus TaxID=8005 RepID=UPI0015D058A4|nr:protein FAM222A [Electrophorus electricus]
MLACLQRRQNQPPQHPVCVGKILDTPVLQKSDLNSMRSVRYPSAAELDAYAQKTADSPLSIKIFPSNVRVPQHKQVSRTVNGLDTTTQRFSPYGQAYSAGYQGLLAIAKAPAATKGVVKGSDGKRTRLSPIQMAVAPYAPSSHGGLAGRHRQRPCGMELCKPPAAPSVPAHPGVVAAASVACLSGGRSLALAPHSDHATHSVARQMARASHGQGLHLPGEAHSSPSRQAATVAVCSDTGFGLVGPAHSSLAYSGAVLPAQPADMAKASGYIDGLDYTLWQPKHQRHPQEQKQHYQQGATLRVYGASAGGRAAVSASPDLCLPAGTTQLAYRGHTFSGGTGAVLDKLSTSPLNCVAAHGEISVSHFFPPAWNGVLATPDGDCYNPQELPLGSVGLGPAHGHARQGHAHAAPPPPYVGPCCGLPGRGLCQASLLSSSLQSLECLISEIHPPCIKERMLGRGYDATAVPRSLDHQPLHIQLPVFR